MDSFNIQNYFKRGKTVVLTLRQGEEDAAARQWLDKDTMVLLKLMNTFLPEFQNERRRKKEVWVDVSKHLHGSGYTWTPEDCRKKWSNMLRTFKGIEEQKQDPACSMKKFKWPFYDVMLEILSLNGADSFPEAASVIQIINGGNITTTYARKHAFKNMSDSTSVHTLHESTQVTGQSQETLITPDIVHMNQTESIGDVHHANHLDTNVLFTENGRYRPDQVAVQATSSFSAYRHSLAVKSKKRAFKRKNGKLDKKGCGDESTDNVLEKFVESTSKQNEQILEKLSTFHDNALALMHERNELLREIRDSLHEDRNISIGSIGTLHQELDGNNSHGTETLTLHMDPSFAGASVDSESNPNHNHPTLVITGAAGSSALSSFQLEDGTVLSSIDPSQTKSQLITNLGHYSNSVLQDGTVSLSNLGTILNPTLPNIPTLVSVVADPNMLTIPANTGKRKITEK